MSKYSYEFKKKVVLEYMEGKGGPVTLTRKYGIPSETRIKEWANSYKSFGDKGLMRSRERKNYTYEYKLRIVELYLTSEFSYQEIASAEGINTPCIITKWVSDFRIAGPDALRLKKKGRQKKLHKSTSSNPKQTKDTAIMDPAIDVSTEHVRKLEDELLKLRIENAYLKELRRLRLEEEAFLKKQRESSTAFEETSN